MSWSIVGIGIFSLFSLCFAKVWLIMWAENEWKQIMTPRTQLLINFHKFWWHFTPIVCKVKDTFDNKIWTVHLWSLQTFCFCTSVKLNWILQQKYAHDLNCWVQVQVRWGSGEGLGRVRKVKVRLGPAQRSRPLAELYPIFGFHPPTQMGCHISSKVRGGQVDSKTVIKSQVVSV